MVKTAWLDVVIMRCPNCERYYAEASWYAIKMESDIECGICNKLFNSKKSVTDRILLKFDVDDNGRANNVYVDKRLSLEKDES